MLRNLSWAWQLTPMIPEYKRLNQEDCANSKAAWASVNEFQAEWDLVIKAGWEKIMLRALKNCMHVICSHVRLHSITGSWILLPVWLSSEWRARFILWRQAEVSCGMRCHRHMRFNRERKEMCRTDGYSCWGVCTRGTATLYPLLGGISNSFTHLVLISLELMHN